MGSVGDCYDNALAESFFATLECELLDRHSFRTQAEARMAVFDLIEDWYNPQRRYSSSGYISPAVLERRAENARNSRRATRFRRSLRMGRYDPQPGVQIPSL